MSRSYTSSDCMTLMADMVTNPADASLSMVQGLMSCAIAHCFTSEDISVKCPTSGSLGRHEELSCLAGVSAEFASSSLAGLRDVRFGRPEGIVAGRTALYGLQKGAWLITSAAREKALNLLCKITG